MKFFAIIACVILISCKGKNGNAIAFPISYKEVRVIKVSVPKTKEEKRNVLTVCIDSLNKLYINGEAVPGIKALEKDYFSKCDSLKDMVAIEAHNKVPVGKLKEILEAGKMYGLKVYLKTIKKLS